MTATSTSADGAAPDGRFETAAQFAALLVAAVERSALDADVRTIAWCDADYVGWPLDDPRLLAALTAFARRPGRRLRMLLGPQGDTLRTRAPRFMAWRTTWDHVVDIRMPDPDAGAPPLPSMAIGAPRWALRRLVSDRWHGVAIVVARPADPAAADPRRHLAIRDLRAWQAEFDAISQQSSPGLPQTIIGL